MSEIVIVTPLILFLFLVFAAYLVVFWGEP